MLNCINESKPSSVDLRKKALHLIENNPDKFSALEPIEFKEIVQELHIYQIELEMQNMALRKSEENLERTQFKYYDLYENAPIGYMICNVEGIIQEANKTLCEIMGVEKNNLINTSFLRFSTHEYQDTFHLNIRKLVEKAEAQSYEMELLRDDGKLIYVDIESTVENNTSGGTSIRLVLIDITERHKLER